MQDNDMDFRFSILDAKKNMHVQIWDPEFSI